MRRCTPEQRSREKTRAQALYDLDGARERISELEAAARAVVWFDWSDNDPDAVRAINALRKLVE